MPTDKLVLSPLLSDGMVLQRETPVKLWGKAGPNEKLRITIRGKTYSTTTDARGNWLLVLAPMSSGGPFTLVIQGRNDEVKIHDILVGDVWLLGGQSNMELPISRTLDLYENEVKNADNPLLRQFSVPMVYAFQAPREELSGGQWKAVTPENILEFSAVGYFFAQALYEKYHLPIGLVCTAVGGTPIEAWLSEEALRKIGGYEEIIDRCKDDHYIRTTMAAEIERMNRWNQQLNEKDEGYQGGARPWSQPAYNDSFWNTLLIPDSWVGSELEPINGAVWFRKTVEVTEERLRDDVLLRLGTIIDADETYINGVLVGNTDYKYPPRKYPVPHEILHAGTNTIAVRVISHRGVGGFVKNKPYCLTVGSEEYDLSGAWKYKIGAVLPPLSHPTSFHYKPTGVYNGMIAPLKNYCFKGILWYQGESNAQQPDNYHMLFKELINNWRNNWQRGDLPFLFVQLPNFLASIMEKTTEANWAKIREAQRLTLSVPNTAMAVTIDAGEDNDLHPQNKKTVGNRLALCARRLVYEEKVVAQGPFLQKMKVRGRFVELFFAGIGKGLVAKGGLLGGFELCGADQKFYPAIAGIAGDRILVSSQAVAQPVGVRYAWTDNPTTANLYNQDGLPASPFQAYI